MTRDRGSAAVLTCVCLSILLTFGAGLGAVAGLLRAHRSAQAAADLAVLAAAHTHQIGGSACRAAAEFARANNAVLVHCEVSGDFVMLEVQVAGPRWLGLEADPKARARAGPD